MEPVGSWYAAASYNRLGGLGSSSGGGGGALGGEQVLNSSAFNHGGFLSPGAAAPYEFPSLFHQKHYQRGLKQGEQEAVPYPPPTFEHQWSQGASPFGVLPHESVPPPKSFEDYSTPHFAPKRTPSPKAPPFYLQSFANTPSHDPPDYGPKPYQNGACAVSSPPVRPLQFERRIDEGARAPMARLEVPAPLKPQLEPYDERRGAQSQSSPISFALMDSSRTYPKPRYPQSFQPDYQRTQGSTAFSAPSVYQQECSAVTPPLDVTLPRSPVVFPSPIGRPSGDGRQGGWGGKYYEGGGGRYYEGEDTPRGDPMSLLKTLQENKEEKETRKEDFRVPPPAHNQGGYYEFERWGGGGGKGYQQVAPLQYVPAFQLAPAPTTSSTVRENGSPPPPPVAQAPQPPPPKVIVPDIEEELGFLSELGGGEEPEPPLAPNPNASFMSSYVKFLQGERGDSPPSVKPPGGRRSVWKGPKVYDPPQNLGEAPPDPRDDPRYFPLPETSESRTFDSDSEMSDRGFSFPPLDKEPSPPRPPPPPSLPALPSTLPTSTKSKHKSPTKKKRKKRAEREDPLEIPPVRREMSRRKAKEKPLPIIDDDDTIPELNDSDSDPAWTPQLDPPDDDYEDGGKKRRSRRISSTKRKLKIMKNSSDEDVPLLEKAMKNDKKKSNKSTVKKRNSVDLTPRPVVNPEPKPPAKLHPLFPFCVDEFVVLASDLEEQNPALWRVKEKAMLQKYQHFVKDGICLYKNLPSYIGWSPECKNVYQAVQVKVYSQSKHELIVQPLCYLLQQIPAKYSSFIEENMKKTLKHQENFEVYIQTLFSQALDVNFLMEIFQEKDEYFLVNMRVIDEVTEGCIERLVGELGWEKLEESLRRLPSYTRLGVPAGAKCSCSTNAVLSLYLSGHPYHKDTLHSLPQTHPHSLEVVLCSKCLERVELIHKLCHQKCALFAHCEQKVEAKRLSDPKKDTTAILNELLADERWLYQLFKEVRLSWALVDSLVKEIGDSKIS